MVRRRCNARDIVQSDAEGRSTRCRGLVFTHDPEVPPDLQGTNDETDFRALVSCLNEDGAGHVITTNVPTAGFPATPSGNADIDADLTLAEECVARGSR